MFSCVFIRGSRQNTDIVTEIFGGTRGRLIWDGEGGLNFTRFADSRKGGGKGGGSREREWGILTVTYRQQAEQSRADRVL